MRIERLEKIACLSQGIQVPIDKQYTFKSNNSIRFLRIIDYTQNKNEIRYIDNPGEKYLVTNRDVVMIRYGDAGRVVRGYTGAIANNLFKIKIDENLILNEYLYYFLSQDRIYKKLTSNKQQTGLPAVNFKMVNEIEISFPESIQTQMKIVAVLDKSQELIDKRKAQIEDLDELVKSKFIEMFGDTFLNTKNFEMKQIRDIVTVVKGITYKPEQVNDEGTIVLRSSNIKGNKFDLNDIVRVNKKIDEKFLVEVNDILMCNRNGSERLVGKVAKIPEYSEPMTFGTFMTIVRSPYHNYLFNFFQTEAFRRQIKMQTSVAINQISIPLLESVKVPLPPIELQNQFAHFVKHTDKLKFEMEESLKELEDNFNSLMQKAFSGKLFTEK